MKKLQENQEITPLVIPEHVFKAKKEELLQKILAIAVLAPKAELIADEILAKARRGWKERCPPVFEDRVDRIFTLRVNSVTRTKKIKSDKDKRTQLNHSRNYDGQLTDVIFNSLEPNEQIYWLEREKFYFDEFEFNKSSDFSILVGLIADEIQMQRLKILQFGATILKSLDLAKEQDACQNRMFAAQKMLGISKVQRELEGNRKEGSIAELSMDLDEKLKKRAVALQAENKKINKFEEDKKQRDPQYLEIFAVNQIKESDIQRLVERSKGRSDKLMDYTADSVAIEETEKELLDEQR